MIGIDIYGFSSGGGGCVLNNTYITLANREQVPVQDLKVGDELLSYNYNIGQYVTAEVSNISASNVTNIIDINNGSLYMSGLGDQPMLVKMQDGVIETTTLGQLNYGMQVYVPLLLKWIPITSIKLLTGSFTVYDIKTIGNVDYIANGVLIIPK
ncbi:MAG: Hint domain-containing protein [Thermoplasmata archaeon]